MQLRARGMPAPHRPLAFFCWLAASSHTCDALQPLLRRCPSLVPVSRPRFSALSLGGVPDVPDPDDPPEPEIVTNWAEELAVSKPEEDNRLPRGLNSDELTVMDVEGEGVSSFVEQLAAISTAADADTQTPEESAPTETDLDAILNSELLGLDKATAYFSGGSESRWMFVGSWPTGDPDANPTLGGKKWRVQWARGVRDDVARRRKHYLSDWSDGFTSKSLAATSFLWFACLAPVLAFGGAMSVLTKGAMGVPEVLLSPLTPP